MRQCPNCGECYDEEVSFCPNDGTATVVVALSDRPSSEITGTIIDGRYRIEGKLGEGGMGVVYKVSHVVLKKALAIKVMRGEQAKDGEIVQRFVQEAQASSAIGHPNIIGISDFGTASDGSVYFAMEYLEGRTLSKAMEKRPMPRARAIDIFVQVADALEAAHQRGIIHRDLKPDNIFLIRQGERDDFVKVLDFGIAKVKNAAAKITRTGMVFGTPHYMSPEQAAGQAVDHRSDIYSTGVIMYQVFTGQLPFDAESYMGVITKHMYDPPAAPSQLLSELRGSIEDIIMMALSKKPEHRYQSMLELRDDLVRARDGQPVRATEQRALLGDTAEFAVDSAHGPGERARSRGLVDDEPLGLPKPRRSMWLIAVAVGVLGFALLVVLRPPGRDDTLEPTAPISVEPAPSEPSVATRAAPAPVRITAVPAEAEILIDGAFVGHGSAVVPRPEGVGHVSVLVRARGFADKAVRVDVQSAEQLHVALEAQAPTPVPRPVTAKPAPSPKPASKPSAAPAKRPNAFSEVVDPWQ